MHHICILIHEKKLVTPYIFAMQILKDFLIWVDQDLGPWGPLAL